VSETLDPGADPRLRFDEPMRCECGGTGTVSDAGDVGGGWWLVAWQTEHRPGCEGRRAPVRAYLVDAEAMAAGDYRLPGMAAEEARIRQRPSRTPTDISGQHACGPDLAAIAARYTPVDWHTAFAAHPEDPNRCQALTRTGRRCRNPAGPDGLCPAHRRRP
jgi:hypothetical protein